MTTPPPDPIVSFTVADSQLPLPANQTTLTWQTVGAASCTLSWQDSLTTVAYGSSWVTNGGTVPTQVTGDAPVNVTVFADDTFTLTASSGGTSYQQQQAVHLVPKFSAVTNPPVVTGVAPTTGDLAGGQQVTITGSGFLGTTEVRFGGAVGTVVSAEVDTQITVIAPGAQAGTVDITVTTITGTSAVTPMDRFGYTAQGLPVVTGVSPGTGNVAAAPESVIISGSGFGTDPTKVTVNFGNSQPAAIASVPPMTDSQITVTAPASPLSGPSDTGVVDVTVTTPAGTSAATAADWFTYWLPGFPMVTEVFPVSGVAGGDPSGGDQVTITGAGFTGVTSVTFGGTPGVVTSSSDTQLTVITPLGAENSTVDVVVQVPAGESPVVPASQFTYAALPNTVSPQQIFRLTWLCPNHSEPHLNWQASGGTASVTVAGQTVSEGDPLPTASGWASVAINALTTFTLQLTYGTNPAGLVIPVNELNFNSFSLSSHTVDPPTGAQSVTFTWDVTDAAELSLTNTSLTDGPVTVPLSVNTESYTAELPLSGFPPGPMTYTLTASGADGSGNYYTPPPMSVQVEPYPVSIAPCWTQLYVSDAHTGQQSVLVEWTPMYATSVTLTVGTTTLYPGIHDTSASVPLPLPPVPPPVPSTAHVLYPVTLSATGYVKPGVTNVMEVATLPLAVQLSSLSAKLNPAKPLATPATVGVTWTAIHATWIVLNGVGYPPDTPQPVTLPLPSGPVGYYSATAYGYPNDAPWPVQETRLKVGKEGKLEGKERFGKEAVSPEVTPLPATGGAGPDDPALPEGTEQAFITPDERPDVGAQLRDADPAG